MTAATAIAMAELPRGAGLSLGRTDWIDIDQSTIDGFGRVTRDEQWIHTDPARAAAGPYGQTIAHGFLSLSVSAHTSWAPYLLFPTQA